MQYRNEVEGDAVNFGVETWLDRDSHSESLAIVRSLQSAGSLFKVLAIRREHLA